MFDALGAPVHFTLTRTADASVEPLTRAEAQTWLRSEASGDATLIDDLIVSARRHFEGETNRALINQTWTMTLDKVPYGGVILLPIAPISSVTSITAYSTDDSSSVVATSVYRLDTSSLPARIVLKDGQAWPSGLRPQNALAIVFVAGYGAASTNVPPDMVLAVRETMAHWFEHREAAVVGATAAPLPLAYQAIVDRHKVPFL